MGGSLRPLDCCDGDCASANGRQGGGYQCERCGERFRNHQLNEDNLCVDCEEAEAEENKEGDNE